MAFFHLSFGFGATPKTPRVFGVANHRIVRRQTFSAVCYASASPITRPWTSVSRMSRPLKR